MENSKYIFNEQTVEYANTLFTSITSELIFVLPSAFICSLISFFIVIAVLVILTKRRLFKRKNKVWNMLAKLHYPLWLFVFVITGFSYGMISSVAARTDIALEKTGRPFIAAATPMLYSHLLNVLPVSSTNEKITIRNATAHIMKDLAYTPKSDSQFESLKSRSINWLTTRMGEWIITYAVNALVTKALQSVDEKLGFSVVELEFTQASLMNMDLSQADSALSEIVYLAIKQRIQSLFGGIQKDVLIMFFSVLLLLLLEPLAYYFFRNKTKTSKSA